MPFMITLLAAALSAETPAGEAPPKVPFQLLLPAERFYPDVAQRMEVEGWAVLRCTPQADRTFADCGVTGEGPGDVGFGQAALRMAPYLRVALKGKALDTVVGRPAEMTLRFQVPASERAPTGVKAPAAAVVDAARPPGAPSDGVATVVCHASFAGGGPLTDCSSGFQAPRDAGFGKAAVDLAASAYVSTLGAAPRRVQASLYLSDTTGTNGSSIRSPDRSLGVRWPEGVWADLVAPAGSARTSQAANPAVFDCDLDAKGALSACTPQGQLSAEAAAASQALLSQAIVERKVYFNVVWSGR